jgi:hypothetical protein
MRKSILLIAALALAVLFSSAAIAKTVLVTLTTQQVATVCGKDLKSGGGHVGCTKNCGSYQCDYDCTKTGCKGQCVTCPGTGRSILPGLKSKRVVKNAVRAAQ